MGPPTTNLNQSQPSLHSSVDPTFKQNHYSSNLPLDPHCSSAQQNPHLISTHFPPLPTVGRTIFINDKPTQFLTGQINSTTPLLKASDTEDFLSSHHSSDLDSPHHKPPSPNCSPPSPPALDNLFSEAQTTLALADYSLEQPIDATPILKEPPALITNPSVLKQKLQNPQFLALKTFWILTHQSI